MVIRAISDLHGNLPPIGSCDLLLVAGDVCPMNDHSVEYQKLWLQNEFTDWLLARGRDGIEIVGIAGNHDFAFEQMRGEILPWTYLQDSSATVNGLVIHGTPWTPNLPSWAFHSGMNSRVERRIIDQIPNDVDILLSHGPPDGLGDQIAGTDTHVGDRTLRGALPRLKPRAVVCGHIHEGYGYYRHPSTEVYNVSMVDEHYKVRRGSTEVNL